jgi:hypothetical protein
VPRDPAERIRDAAADGKQADTVGRDARASALLLVLRRARQSWGMCDSNSGYHDGGRGGPRPILGPLFQPARPKSRDPRPRSRIASSTPEARKPAAIGHCGRWRDPDSNRGHHDFQARQCARFGPRKCCKYASLSDWLPRSGSSLFADVVSRFGGWTPPHLPYQDP